MDDVDRSQRPVGAMEASESAGNAGKCRFIEFACHSEPEAHATFPQAYGEWDTGMMPVPAADHKLISPMPFWELKIKRSSTGIVLISRSVRDIKTLVVLPRVAL